MELISLPKLILLLYNVLAKPLNRWSRLDDRRSKKRS
jgi:hypothetical protein